jgi:Gly-Xaa carboxypeptidase
MMLTVADLTKNVYRWTPTRKGGTQNAHTVDEAIDMHAHMEALKFYYDLIRNFDQSDA